MAPDRINLDAPSRNGVEQKSFDQEIKELISTLTNRLGSIQRSPNNPGDYSGSQDDEDQGVRIITLAGSNLGATMRGGRGDDKPASDPQGQGVEPEQEDFATFVNSNFQAINNSIMMGGSYETNDPGVHLNIVDEAEELDEDEAAANNGKMKSKKIMGKARGDDPPSESTDRNTADGE
ncbi:uncharacterized protein LOC127260923 [Andrographis paniculata]|uniref:uncharacterized protein LOC127260923 n=1 Tax=Andrographis paniculata TaxID=175694 RepID=UPI0021E6E73C|nr:uncharacterized protein LOC127260923 [Andrographis paniculata]